jgi:hypothetical protein
MKKSILLTLLFSLFFIAMTSLAHSAEAMTCWFPPGWKSKTNKARAISKALSDKSGISIRPRIAKSYPIPSPKISPIKS